jgi:hypothetical protein
MEACYGGADVMERSCAVARGKDINRFMMYNVIELVLAIYGIYGSRSTREKHRAQDYFNTHYFMWWWCQHCGLQFVCASATLK